MQVLKANFDIDIDDLSQQISDGRDQLLQVGGQAGGRAQGLK